MTKLLTIFGATGNQGGSIANYVVTDPVLSKEYSIRAVTRNPDQPVAQALAAKGIQVVQGDLDDAASVKAALQGAHTVFATSTTIYDDQLKEREVRQGRTIVDAAVEAGVQYLIWSTLSSPTIESKGKYAKVDSFDSKYEVEEYIRSLPIKSAFFAPGCFMRNFTTGMAPRPTGDEEGTFAIANVIRPDSKMPMIDIENDTGKYVAAILSAPDEYEGKVLSAATDFYSLDDVAKTISHVTGKKVVYKQLPVEVYKGFLPPTMAECLTEMMLYAEEFGYYGSESREKAAWTAKNARGKLTTLEEFLSKNPPQGLA